MCHVHIQKNNSPEELNWISLCPLKVLIHRYKTIYQQDTASAIDLSSLSSSPCSYPFLAGMGMNSIFLLACSDLFGFSEYMFFKSLPESKVGCQLMIFPLNFGCGFDSDKEQCRDCCQHPPFLYFPFDFFCLHHKLECCQSHGIPIPQASRSAALEPLPNAPVPLGPRRCLVADCFFVMLQ